MKYPEVPNHIRNDIIQEMYKNNENDEIKSSGPLHLYDEEVRAEKRKFEKFSESGTCSSKNNDIDDKNDYDNDSINVNDDDNDGVANYNNNENIDSKRVLNINKKPRIASIENDDKSSNNNYDNNDNINDINHRNDQNMNTINSHAKTNKIFIDDEIEGINLIISSVYSINWIDTMIHDTGNDRLHNEHTENVVNTVNKDELKFDEFSSIIDKGSTKINENNTKKLDKINVPPKSTQQNTESEEIDVNTRVDTDIRESADPGNQVSGNMDTRSSVNPDIRLSVNTVLSSPSSSKIIDYRENKLHLELLSSCRMHRIGVLRASTASAGGISMTLKNVQQLTSSACTILIQIGDITTSTVGGKQYQCLFILIYMYMHK